LAQRGRRHQADQQAEDDDDDQYLQQGESRFCAARPAVGAGQVPLA
jgi:hypothetical protein